MLYRVVVVLVYSRSLSAIKRLCSAGCAMSITDVFTKADIAEEDLPDFDTWQGDQTRYVAYLACSTKSVTQASRVISMAGDDGVLVRATITPA